MKSDMCLGVSNPDITISTFSAPVSQKNIHSLEKNPETRCKMHGER